MMKWLENLDVFSTSYELKPGKFNRGDSTMDANSKNFEVELMAQDQLEEKVTITERPRTAKMP